MIVTGLAFVIYGVVLLLTSLAPDVVALVEGVVILVLAVLMGERFPMRRS